jgi:putative oxidoreductase
MLQQPPERFHPYNRLDARVMEWLTRHSLAIMRISLGFVFLVFGVLKFFPDMSPAEDLTIRTMDALTFGLVSGRAAMIIVATMECAVGISLLTGLFLQAGVVLLGLVMIGVLAPLVLFPGQMFSGRFLAPTLEAQYVVKDVVLLAAGINVGLRARGARRVMTSEGSGRSDTDTGAENA